ncbi:Gfo/Idh/MocA family protein [Tepidibacillus fermentans]|uniref:Putative dehydrogenase n=1 Tax=Tepidibacillus fermentans TaxID=1281767 RepID=A0A4R3KJL5_9BACI|nr:Gfo/Idh/MocA family oxidoreductase [Tepidibacillus fermentans]TCS83361.1 putative dehydrogenase [Tepidibacillus fermentans]
MNFAIVGCGRIAPKHAESIMALEEANLVAVCDIIDEKAEEFAKKYNAKKYLNYDEMLEDPEIEVVNICTPSGLHAEMAIKAIEKGKHVMVEKPIAMTVEDANRIIEAAKRKGVKAAAVHQNRFNDAIQKTRQALEAGRFGKMSHGVASIRWNRNQAYYDQASWRGTREMDGGTLMNQCIHNIDLLRWMMGPVKKVYGNTATRFRRIEMEDVGVAVLEFESGALGVIEGASTIYPTNLEETLNLFGETGTVVVGGIAVNRIEKWRFSENFKEEEEAIVKAQAENPPTVYGYGHQLIIKDFIDAIKENRDPYVTLEDGKNALEIVLAIYESAEKDQPVYLNQK